MLLRWPAGLPHATPNARSLHDVPVPRVGGIALWVGWVAGTRASQPHPPPRWAWGSGASRSWCWRAFRWPTMCARSSVGVRLAVHAGAGAWLAVALAATQASIDAPALALLIGAALATVWSLNLYNFMDGIRRVGDADGNGRLRRVRRGRPRRWPAGNAHLVAGRRRACRLFIANRPSARMFIGDVGAVPLGFLAAALGLGGMLTASCGLPGFRCWSSCRSSPTPRRRCCGGCRDGSGSSRRTSRTTISACISSGAGHRGTLAVYAALMGGTATTAVICASRYPAWGARALAVWCVICLMLFAAIDYHWRRKMLATP